MLDEQTWVNAPFHCWMAFGLSDNPLRKLGLEKNWSRRVWWNMLMELEAHQWCWSTRKTTLGGCA